MHFCNNLHKISLSVQNRIRNLLSGTSKTQLHLSSWRMTTYCVTSVDKESLHLPAPCSNEWLTAVSNTSGVSSRAIPLHGIKQGRRRMITDTARNQQLLSLLLWKSWRSQKMKTPRKADFLSYSILMYGIRKLLSTHTPRCIQRSMGSSRLIVS